MTVTLKEISGFLDQIGYKHGVEDERIVTGVQLDDGHSVPMLITAPKDGNLFQLAAINVIPVEAIKQSEYKTAFMFYLLHTAWETSFCTPEMDTDGELRVLVEIPLADAVMTVNQLAFILKGLIMFSEKIHAEGLHLLSTGQKLESATAESEAGQETMAMTILGQLLPTAEGRAKLRQLLQNPEAPPVLRAAIQNAMPAMDILDAQAGTLAFGPATI